MAFQSFILLAEMRTGSNFLETNLNAYDRIACHGEAFNPHFIGYPNTDTILGVSREARDDDPRVLLDQVRAQVGIHGFRFFHDHDPRVLAETLPDPTCAKVILTRNPIDSYVSLKIARATGQWKLTNAKAARSSQIEFDRDEFEAHLDDTQRFQIFVQKQLQKTGQTAFYVSYDDLHDIEVMNGLAQWLGSPETRDGLDTTLKPQNPKPIGDKVENLDAMAQSLARLDRFNLSRTPNFEPRRGPVVPSYVVAPKSPLLFQGIRGGPEAAVRSWLAALDDASEDALQVGLTQSTLRKWQNKNHPHRAFTVLRHPLARAHAAFCEKILPTDGDAYLEIRETLKRQYQVPLTADPDAKGYDHRAAFAAFLVFVARNLQHQTSLRVDPYWATQSAVIEGFSTLRAPDMILREETLQDGLAVLAADLGHDEMPALADQTDPYAERLAQIYDVELDKLARAAYLRDYQAFGFGRWRP